MKRPGLRLALLSAGALLACLALAGCGGGGGSGGSSASTPQQLAGNQVALTVDHGPPGANALNSLYVSVTVCAPGTSNCQTIDHVLVDTASSGLRILASAMAPGLVAALPQSTDGSGHAMVECAQFVDGYLWGPTRLADVKMGAETAGGAVIQIVSAPGSPPVPASCSGTGPALDSVATLGANGLLGVSTFAQDCGSGCVGVTNNGLYYSCAGSACSPSAATLAQQLWNPVALFASDNNGISISLPSVAASGAVSLTGTMTFGIGTETNNRLPPISVLTVDPVLGDLNTTAGGTSYPGSYVDSGSNAYFFGSALYPACTTFVGFYCPPGAQGVSAVLQGVNGATAAGNFIVGNPEALFASHPSITADAEIAGPNGPPSNGFDWGLPLFFGATVYTAIENRSTPTIDGPWIAIH